MFDKIEHDAHHPEHSGEEGHYCYEWDYLYICKDCPEFIVCHCTVSNDKVKGGE